MVWNWKAILIPGPPSLPFAGNPNHSLVSIPPTDDPVVPASSALGLAQPFGQYPHRKQGDIETGYSHYPRMCVVAPDGAVTRTVDESSDWVGLFWCWRTVDWFTVTQLEHVCVCLLYMWAIWREIWLEIIDCGGCRDSVYFWKLEVNFCSTKGKRCFLLLGATGAVCRWSWWYQSIWKIDLLE